LDELKDSWTGYEDWSGRRKRITMMRWGTVIAYIIIVTVVSLLYPFVDMEEWAFTILVLIVSLGGMCVVFAAMLYPYFKKEREPVVPDGEIVERVSLPSVGPFHESVKMDILLYVMVPLIIMYAAIMVIVPDPLMIIIMVIVIAFLLILVLFFYSLEIHCDGRTLSFHYGPIGKDIPVEEVESIRPTAVHALKDFMGYGIRMGPDGSVGYIAKGNVGVKVTVKNGKEYVITMTDPQGLVDCVRRGGGGTR
jgi:MFS family permease